MSKKNMLLIALILSCNTTYTVGDKTDETKQDNRYTVGSLILANTYAVTAGYFLVSMTTTSVYLSSDDRRAMLNMMSAIAVVTTTGCVIVEGINGLDHLINPSNRKDPKLKTDIKELADQK